MSLYDRLVPAEALRFDRAHPMTRAWPELDLWTRANPAIGERIDVLAMWDEFEANVIATPPTGLPWRKRR